MNMGSRASLLTHPALCGGGGAHSMFQATYTCKCIRVGGECVSLCVIVYTCASV